MNRAFRWKRHWKLIALLVLVFVALAFFSDSVMPIPQ